MYFAIVHYLENIPDFIPQIRKLYDLRSSIVAPHITLVFPTKKFTKQELKSHLVPIISEYDPIRITWDSITLSQDGNIFLTLSEGNNKVIALHDDLYSGILNQSLRTDLTYTPHVTLGSTNEKNKNKVIQGLKQYTVSGEIIIKDVSLVSFPDLDAPDSWREDFTLGTK